VRSAKINCTQVLLSSFMSTMPPFLSWVWVPPVNRCTQTQLIIKKICTQLKYLIDDIVIGEDPEKNESGWSFCANASHAHKRPAQRNTRIIYKCYVAGHCFFFPPFRILNFWDLRESKRKRIKFLRFSLTPVSTGEKENTRQMEIDFLDFKDLLFIMNR